MQSHQPDQSPGEVQEQVRRTFCRVRRQVVLFHGPSETEKENMADILELSELPAKKARYVSASPEEWQEIVGRAVPQKIRQTT